MDRKAVYKMHDEYKQYKKNNFTSNFRTLKKTFLDDKARADADQAAFVCVHLSMIKSCLQFRSASPQGSIHAGIGRKPTTNSRKTMHLENTRK